MKQPSSSPGAAGSVKHYHTPRLELRDIGVDGDGVQGIAIQTNPISRRNPWVVHQRPYVTYLVIGEMSRSYSLVKLDRIEMSLIWFTEAQSHVRLVRLDRGEMSLIWFTARESFLRLVQCSIPVRSVMPLAAATRLVSPSRSDCKMFPVGFLITRRMAASRFGSGKVTTSPAGVGVGVGNSIIVPTRHCATSCRSSTSTLPWSFTSATRGSSPLSVIALSVFWATSWKSAGSIILVPAPC